MPRPRRPGAQGRAALRQRKEVAFGKLPSGAAPIVPGSPAQQRAGRAHPEHRPGGDDAGARRRASRSTTASSAILVRWIEQGAEWKPHWAFIPPTKRRAARGEGPRAGRVARSTASSLARSSARACSPSPEADRRDAHPPRLTLRPDRPAADARRGRCLPGRRVAGRLREASSIACSPRRATASAWRSTGSTWPATPTRTATRTTASGTMWPWRDWVIGAFNRNLPFDQFTTEQLAGDLLPDATVEQQLATGFNRNHMQSQEGGIVPEEYRAEYVVDRVNTLGRVLLGLTIGCARCHDHKYDPDHAEGVLPALRLLQQRERDRADPVLGHPEPDGDRDGRRGPGEARGDPGDASRPLEAETVVDGPAFDARLRRLAGARTALGAEPRALPASPWSCTCRSTAACRRERSRTTEGKKKAEEQARRTKWKKVLRFANLADPRHPASLGGDEDRVPKTVGGRSARRSASWATATSELRSEDRRASSATSRSRWASGSAWRRRAWPGRSSPAAAASSTATAATRSSCARTARSAPASTTSSPTTRSRSRRSAAIAPGDWHHVALTYDGSSRAAGLRLFLDGRAAESRVDRGQPPAQHPPRREGEELGRSRRAAHRPPPRRDAGRRRPSTSCASTTRQLTAVRGRGSRRRARGARPGPRAAPAAERSAAERAALREHYVLRVQTGLEEKRRALMAARGEENALLTSLPEVMSMRELPQRPGHLRPHARAPTTRRPSGWSRARPRPSSPFPKDLPPNRLGLARWLARPEAPAHRARDREPLLGALLRPRAGRDAGGLRQPGPPADPSGAARLARHHASSTRAGT